MSETEKSKATVAKKTTAKSGTRKSTKTTGETNGTKSRKTSSKSSEASGEPKKPRKTAASKTKKTESTTEVKKTRKTTGTTHRKKTSEKKETATKVKPVQENLFDEKGTAVSELAPIVSEAVKPVEPDVVKEQLSLNLDEKKDIATTTSFEDQPIITEYRLFYTDENPGRSKFSVYVPELPNGREEFTITYKDGDDIAAEEEAERKRLAEEKAKQLEEERLALEAKRRAEEEANRLANEAKKQAEDERKKAAEKEKLAQEKQAAHERYLKEQVSLKRKQNPDLEETMQLDQVTEEIRNIELAENMMAQSQEAPAPSIFACVKDPIRYIQTMLDRSPDGLFTNVVRAMFMWAMIALAYVNWFAKSVNEVAFSIARVNFSDGSWLFVRIVFIGILLELLTAMIACIVAKISGLPYSYREVFHDMSASDIPSGLLFAVCGILMHFAPVPGLILSVAGWIFAFYTRALVLDRMLDMKNSRFIYFVMLLYAFATFLAVTMFRQLCPDVFRILDSLLNI